MDLGYPLTPFEILEYTGRALEQCQAIPSLKEYTAFCEVVGHRVTMPANLVYIQQIARNNCFEAAPTCPILLEEQVTDEIPESCVMEPAVIDCNGNLINGCDYSYYRPFWAGQMSYFSFYGTPTAKECYTPVRLKNHSFFSSLVCAEYDPELYEGCRDEYGIDGDDLILSFAEGQIAISYFGPERDKDGKMLIPDHETYIKAILAYIRYHKATKRYDESPSGPNYTAKKDAEEDWHWYCRQAINLGLFEGGKDGMQDLRDIGGWILPPGNRYDNFFGNLTYPQDRVNILGGEQSLGG